MSQVSPAGCSSVDKKNSRRKEHCASAGVPADGGGLGPHKLKVDNKDFEFVCECVNILIEVLRLHGFEPDGVKFSATMDHYRRLLWIFPNPVKLIKYKIAAFFAYHMSTEDSPLELPELPHVSFSAFDHPGIILGGRAYKYVTMMKNKDPKWMASFCTSVLYSKGGMPRPSDQFVKQAEDDAFKKLTEPSAVGATRPISLVSWGDDRKVPQGTPVILNRENFVDQLRRTVREVFAGKTFSEEHQQEPFFPSTSANYLNSRSGGGAVGHLIEFKRLMENVRKVGEGLPGIELYQVNPAGRLSMETRRYKLRTDVLRSRWKKFMEFVEAEARAERALAIPLGLKESLKARVISKGPPMIYTYLKPLQKFLWGSLVQHKPFSLIGRPVDKWYVQDVLGGTLKNDQKFLSVDYSDATNNMHLWVSDVLVDLIADELKLSDVMREIFKKGLVGHTMVHPRTGEEKLQKRGQLMGSVVSFPLLCIVNFTILRWTRELDMCREFDLDNAGVMVNGDDGCFKATRYGYDLWKKIAEFAGLSPSVGKVYFSRQFMNINSTNFTFSAEPQLEDYTDDKGEKRDRKINFQLTLFIRMSLYMGMQRSTGVAQSGAPLNTLGSQVRQLIQGCPEGMRETVLCSWISKHRKKLHGVQIPWFLPEELGGFGLPYLKSDKPVLQTNDLFLRVARKIHDHPEIYSKPNLPLEKEWMTWNIAQKLSDKLFRQTGGHRPSDAELYMMNQVNKDTEHSGLKAISAGRLTNALVVDTFINTTKLEDLQNVIDSTKADTIIKNYYRAWHRIYTRAIHDQSIKLPEPYNMDNLPKEVKLVTNNDKPYLEEDLSSALRQDNTRFNQHYDIYQDEEDRFERCPYLPPMTFSQIVNKPSEVIIKKTNVILV